MTIQQVADYCRVSRSLVYKWIKQGRLHPQPVHPLYGKGAKTAIPRHEVEALLPKPEDLARLPKPGE